MDIKKPEISEKKSITKSQKRHQKKVEKRKLKKEIRKKKQLKEQQESGKLIEENHNGGLYSSDFTRKAVIWYIEDLSRLCVECQGDSNKFLIGFRSLRPKIQTVLLKWSDDLERTGEFWFFKKLLEIYWEDKTSGKNVHEYCQYILTLQGFLE